MRDQLLDAIWEDDIECVSKIIEAGVPISDYKELYSRALFSAADYGRLEAAKVLIKAGPMSTQSRAIAIMEMFPRCFVRCTMATRM